MNKKLNISDEEDVIAFLKENEFSTNIELGQLAGVHAKTIRLWRKKYGMNATLKSNTKFTQSYKMPKKLLPKVRDPKEWDNKEWFQKFYGKYGIILLGKIIGKSVALVYGRLRKYGIRVRSHREAMATDSYFSNPCCNEKWLLENYIDKGLSIAECAELASVNRYTIYNWLAKFGIEVRDRCEAAVLARLRCKSIGDSSANKEIALLSRQMSNRT